jgi:hypothetical protein
MERAKPSSRSGWPVWLNAAALLVVSFIAVTALSFQARPDSDVVAVVFPPWWRTQHIFEATASADASIVRTTAFAAVIVVKPDEHRGMDRLREAGAWLTIDPQAIAGCFNTEKGI